MQNITKEKLASIIDHSEVRQDSTEEEVRLRCAEAKKYRFASLYVCPCYIQLAKNLLKGSGIPLGTAIAFPHGATTTEVKVYEAKEAGAHFVKTSTGFLAADPTVEDVQLIRETVGSDFGVKAAGGIKTADKAIAMIEAGVDLIGETAGVSLVEGLNFIVSLMKEK